MPRYHFLPPDQEQRLHLGISESSSAPCYPDTSFLKWAHRTSRGQLNPNGQYVAGQPEGRHYGFPQRTDMSSDQGWQDLQKPKLKNECVSGFDVKSNQGAR